MSVNIYTKDIDLLESTRNGCIEIITSKLSKFLDVESDSTTVNIELSQTTRHHHNSDVQFRAEVRLINSGKEFYAANETDDLYKSTHAVADEISAILKKDQGKSRSLLRRAQSTWKKIIRRN